MFYFIFTSFFLFPLNFVIYFEFFTHRADEYFFFFLILNLNCRNLTDPMYLQYLDAYLLIDL